MPFDATPPETETDVFTLPAFTEWLETQVAMGRGAEEYCWDDNGTCLFAQYAAEHGATYGANFIGLEGTKIAWTEPHTFEAALQRARECGA